ncbi:hypothetical protein EJ04DRAFT_589900 [Polyplosphaeria fusca]|uniref:alpha-galactosidase n=1 Tax=Polyplosphaeria fusca TaxID=682080 RepID=A0A9P4QQL9_9PLEO|nr:hypothetical protein EJ04DRAFT_589900 [Polyplosphaeria fusca]
MYAFISTALILATASSAKPLQQRADITQFPKGSSWDIVLKNEGYTLNDFQNIAQEVIDIDLYDNTANDADFIQKLADKKKVICYFSAGSREDWRDDANDFKWPNDYGKNMTGTEPGETWPGENWLNVTSKNVRDIMTKRVLYAKEKGCNAIDPDNVDGFAPTTTNGPHQDGYKFDASVYRDYVLWLADLAHKNGMAMGLKNAMDLLPGVGSQVDFAVNEQCHALNECGVYKSWQDQKGVAVYNIEYAVRNCTEKEGVKLSGVFKTLDLNKLGGQC